MFDIHRRETVPLILFGPRIFVIQNSKTLPIREWWDWKGQLYFLQADCLLEQKPVLLAPGIQLAGKITRVAGAQGGNTVHPSTVIGNI